MMLETYCRKHPKGAHQAISTTTDMDQCSQKEAAQSSKPPFLGRHQSQPYKLLTREPEEDGKCKSQMQNHIKVGNLYEFDHSQLAPRSPVHLRSIRVVMVSEKTELSVAVRFPSMESLRAFFSNRTVDQTEPAMDEKYVMGTALAAKVLIRLVPREVFNEEKGKEAFWLMSYSSTYSWNAKGVCLSEIINCKGMVRWGVKRQVKYIGRQREVENGNDVNTENSSASSFVDAIGDGTQMEVGGPVRVMGSENNEQGNVNDDQEDEEVEVESEEEKINENDKNLKGKRCAVGNIDHVRKPKKEKVEKKRKQKNQARKNTGTRFNESVVPRNPKDRWSAERYKLAEQSLLEVMKAKGATADKPILRPQLRIEARKRIGDTGLLDHLLKHMAGRLAPGGEERFRRRHNADGAMEYWLESADLVNIRKNAGVNDPFWVPPPGWNPGDPPMQDPTCARELKLLKDEMSKIKRDVELMVTKMQLEEELGKLRRELDEFTSRTKEEKQSPPSHYNISQTLDQLPVSLVPSKLDLDKAPVSAAENYKKQLMNISDFVNEVEEKIGLVERTSPDSALMTAADKKCKQEVQALMAADAEKPEPDKDKNIAEAAKIQRVKSGFRVCRPQGTFLWPNMAKNCNTNSGSNMSGGSSKVVVQVEVPTPPSVSSSPAFAPPHRNPASPIKPLAERRAIMVTVSDASPHSGNWLALSGLKSAPEECSHG